MPQLRALFREVFPKFLPSCSPHVVCTACKCGGLSDDERPEHDSRQPPDPTVQGLALLYLLTDTSAWVHRRIESIRLSELGVTRRYVSQDVTISDQGKVFADSRNRIVVPLGWMSKGPVSKLDAMYDGGKLVVLGKKEHTEFIVQMIVSTLEVLCGSRTLLADDRKIFEDVLDADDDESVDVSLKKFRVLMDELVPPENLESSRSENRKTIETMVELLATHYVFLVEVDENLVGTRCTLKYSLDLAELDISDAAPIEFHWTIPNFQFAASQHVEVEVPKTLNIQRLRFAAIDAQDEVSQVQDDVPTAGARTAHVVLRPADGDVKADVTVTVQPSVQGLYSFAWWSVVLFVVLVECSVVVRIFDSQILGKVEIPSNSASILLIAPAVLLSWVSREQEHSLVSLLLRPLRKILLVTALLLVSIAGLIAVPLTSVAWNVAWGVIYASTLALLLYAEQVFGRYRKPLN